MIRGLWFLPLARALLSPWIVRAQTFHTGVQTLNTKQVSVATTATQVAINRARLSVTVENLGTNMVCFGQTNAVTLANGICLPGTVGAAVTIPFTGAVWGIATSSATTVAVMDLF